MLSTLRQVGPAPAELIDVPTAADHCRVDANDDGVLLEVYIGMARQWAEGWLGRSLVPQNFIWTVSDVARAQNSMTCFAATPSPGTLIVPSLVTPWPPRHPIEFPRAPVTSITSVTMGGFSVADAALTADDYDLDLASDPARIALKSSAAVAQADRMTVAFTAGYAGKADVPRPIFGALLILTAHFWEHRGDAPASIPQQALDLMWHYRLMSFG